MRRLLAVAVLTAAPALGACRATDALQAAEVAGTYRLESVTGEAVPTHGSPAVLAGTLVLGADGSATRRVEYATGGGPGMVYEARGTFALHGNSVVLALVEDPTRPNLVWRPLAARQGTVVTLRSRDPADGPDIVEVYRRE